MRPSKLRLPESTLTATGAKADHRLPIRASEVEAFALAVASAVGASGLPSANLTGDAAKFAGVVAKDLKANRGKSLVIAGEHQSPSVHAIAHAINAALGAPGSTLYYADPLEVEPVDQRERIRHGYRSGRRMVSARPCSAHSNVHGIGG